ncbi:MAG: hemolysin family protein [Chlamydiales bacterium]
MVIIFFFLSLFLLIWVFFLATVTHSLTRLGESHSIEILRKHPRQFFYYPIHHNLFEKQNFELLILSSTLGENLARLGFVALIIVGFLFFNALTLTAAIIILIVLLFLVLMLGDFFPRLWAIKNPERALAFSAQYASFFLFLSLPITFLFLKLASFATRSLEKEEGKESLEEMKDAILQILRSVSVKEKLNVSDKKLIESVLKFKERIVREVMVPRAELFSLPAETPIRKAARELSEEGYSRIPIYRETIDNIVGVLMFKDIIELYMDCDEGKKESAILDAPIETISKSVFYTPETKKVSHLLQELRAKQIHMAIVIDEYGGTEGVVTLEDILEEIVGEIEDEYDFEEEMLYTTQPGGEGWIVDARMTIHDAEDAFGIQIPQEGDYDTIGGYVFHKVGSIPKMGHRLYHEDFVLEILSSTERSIEKVRITPQ